MDYVYAKKLSRTEPNKRNFSEKNICFEWWKKIKKNLNLSIAFPILKYSRSIGSTDSAMRRKCLKG